jgi:hypothetical protein
MVAAIVSLLRVHTPRIARDYVADLGRPLPIGSLADARTLTSRDIVVLVRQLAKQGQIAAPLATTGIADLATLQSAPTAKRAAALAKLASDLDHIIGAAGPLLEAASGLPIPAE